MNAGQKKNGLTVVVAIGAKAPLLETNRVTVGVEQHHFLENLQSEAEDEMRNLRLGHVCFLRK